jgi:hypothetical protein
MMNCSKLAFCLTYKRSQWLLFLFSQLKHHAFFYLFIYLAEKEAKVCASFVAVRRIVWQEAS